MRSESLRNPAILAAGALAILGCALIYFVIENGLQQRSGDSAVRFTEQVIGDLQALQAQVADAESGQRGFLLTGDDSYLKPYHAAPAAIDAVMRRLHGDDVTAESSWAHRSEPDPEVAERLGRTDSFATYEVTLEDLEALLSLTFDSLHAPSVAVPFDAPPRRVTHVREVRW